MTHRV